jgi:tyrosine-protein kinase Etk/Wzc
MGRRVLVVDADLHAPTQHLQFMVKGSPGLAQILTEPTVERAREAIQMTETGVALLAAGAAGIAPSQLMSRDASSELSSVLRSLGYQVIVIDSPPILTSAETLLFSRLADDTVLTVRSGSSRERDVKQALDVLQRNGTPAAGVILNDYKDAVGALRPALGASAATLRTELPAAVREVTSPLGNAAAAVPLSNGRVPV